MSFSNDVKKELIKIKFHCKNCKSCFNLSLKPLSECCKISYLRGVFIKFGSIANPQREYHLEICIDDENEANYIGNLFYEFDIDFKLTVRGKSFVLYLKDSRQIEDTLAVLGAVKASMEIMNLKIEKEIRNQANRATNCETANIDKAVNASLNQIEKINLIINKKGLEFLSDELKEIALLRLDNPDASLKDLCEINQNKLSKSGINHRLKKICDIADNLI
ncbi:MAG: DNA-binding protein WhiA [Oscillospiraceae bacterium]